MKHIKALLAAVVAMGCAWNVAAGPDTNTFAIYLSKSMVAVTAIKNGAFYPEGLNLDPQPILTGADFDSYDVATHTFKLKADSARRFAKEWRSKSEIAYSYANPEIEGIEGRDLPFLLCANGKPVYAGMLSNARRELSISCTMSFGRDLGKPYPVMEPRDYFIRKNDPKPIAFSINRPNAPVVMVAAPPIIPSEPILRNTVESVLPSPTETRGELFQEVVSVESEKALPDPRSDKRILDALKKLKLSR